MLFPPYFGNAAKSLVLETVAENTRCLAKAKKTREEVIHHHWSRRGSVSTEET